MPRRHTILLVGVGSLLGRCVLDSIAGRRENLVVIGGDLYPDAPALADCDFAVSLPADDDAGFADCVEDLCRQHNVDLVIPCRDPANAVLSAVGERPGSSLRLAAASGDLVAMTRDKAASSAWCRDHSIPHAPTVSTDALDDGAHEAVIGWGLPLIAKPARGSGSLGVTVVQTPAQLEAVLATPGMVLQPFISPPDAPLELDISRGLPLFWEVPCDFEPGVMALFGPDGEIGPHLCFSARHRLGRNEELWTLDDATLEAFASDVLPKFAAAGWRGPLNLQVRRNADGWQIIEINARFSGGTAARLHLGLDELGWILNRYLSAEAVPEWDAAPVATVKRIHREVPVPARDG